MLLGDPVVCCQETLQCCQETLQCVAQRPCSMLLGDPVGLLEDPVVLLGDPVVCSLEALQCCQETQCVAWRPCSVARRPCSVQLGGPVELLGDPVVCSLEALQSCQETLQCVAWRPCCRGRGRERDITRTLIRSCPHLLKSRGLAVLPQSHYMKCINHNSSRVKAWLICTVNVYCETSLQQSRRLHC